MIDATHLKAHRTAASLLKKGIAVSDAPEAGSTLHAVCDSGPLIMLLTEGQVSDYRGAATVFGALPKADALIADKGSDRFRKALAERGTLHPRPPQEAGRL